MNRRSTKTADGFEISRRSASHLRLPENFTPVELTFAELSSTKLYGAKYHHPRTIFPLAHKFGPELHQWFAVPRDDLYEAIIVPAQGADWFESVENHRKLAQYIQTRNLGIKTKQSAHGIEMILASRDDLSRLSRLPYVGTIL